MQKRRQLLSRLVAAVALLATLSPLNAAADMIFDFEDGTFQGWEPMNDVFLAPTNGVFGPGGSIALFGLDGAWISMDVDLTNVDRLVLDVFTPSKAALDPNALFVTVRPSDTPPSELFDDWEAIDGEANPGRLAISLEHLTGVHEIRIAWNGLSFPTATDPPYGGPTVFFPAYIDKITFATTLPEPAGVVLLGVALARLMIGRSRMIRKRGDC